jgi:hypothetical protein
MPFSEKMFSIGSKGGEHWQVTHITEGNIFSSSDRLTLVIVCLISMPIYMLTFLEDLEG